MNHPTLILAIAYLLGSIPFGYILVRLFLHQDIRATGSGNIGATNVARSGAKGLGIATLLQSPPAPSVVTALYVGDDTTDLDAFRGLRSLVSEGALTTAICAAVSSDEAPPELAAEADLLLDGTGGVRSLLQALL